MLGKLLQRNEFLVGLVVVGFCLVTGLTSERFFSLVTLFDLLRNATVIGIFAIGVMLVLISGGIDVSFTALAAFSMYATTSILVAWGADGHFVLALLIAAAFGLALGMVNAFFIGLFGLPTLIVTLGTLSAFRGFLLTFVGSELITTVPGGMRDFSRANLFTGTTADGYFFSLPLAFLALVIVVLITWFILNRTLLGRSIYAIGGSPEAAARIGINVRATQFFIYGYVGVLSGVAGIIHASMARVANPFDLVGLELSVIAAVVLGGARLTGGYGTITGTLLGVALIVLVNNSLILLGVPSTWQSVVIGLLILLGTGVPAYQARRTARHTV